MQGNILMKFIGITGGVGAGKSFILAYLKDKYQARILLADDLAKDLMKPGTSCNTRLKEAFSDADVFAEDGSVNAKAMAQLIFQNPNRLLVMNGIVHPAVKEEVKRQYELAKEDGVQLLILEAALLIEEKYDEICDELWYIYTSEDIRRERLKESRGYSDEKIDSIFASQLSEEQFRLHCAKEIDNNGSFEDVYRQIDKALAESASV